MADKYVVINGRKYTGRHRVYCGKGVNGRNTGDTFDESELFGNPENIKMALKGDKEKGILLRIKPVAKADDGKAVKKAADDEAKAEAAEEKANDKAKKDTDKKTKKEADKAKKEAEDRAKKEAEKT